MQTILLTIYTLVKAIEAGVESAPKLIKMKEMREMLKKALPHQANLIDEWELNAFYLFVDELEGNVLSELTKMLDGADIDKASVMRSAEIMTLSKAVTNELDRAPVA